MTTTSGNVAGISLPLGQTTKPKKIKPNSNKPKKS